MTTTQAKPLKLFANGSTGSTILCAQLRRGSWFSASGGNHAASVDAPSVNAGAPNAAVKRSQDQAAFEGDNEPADEEAMHYARTQISLAEYPSVNHSGRCACEQKPSEKQEIEPKLISGR